MKNKKNKKNKKKLFFVKREVFATTIEQAMTGKGIVYEIQTADEKYQPKEEKTLIGF